MPKPIINTGQNKLSEGFISPKDLSINESSLKDRNTFKSSELMFREKRPQTYIDIMKSLDIEGLNITKEQMKELVEGIQNAIPEIVFDDEFIGVIGKCYHGEDFDVHTLSRNIVFGIDERTFLPGFGRLILKHFHSDEPLPSGLEKGRSLANNPNYFCVEVYTDKLIAVSENGDVSIVRDSN